MSEKPMRFCPNCQCTSCIAMSDAMDIARAVKRGEPGKWWSCSCGWLRHWSDSELAEYGEIDECNRCCREDLTEVDPSDFRIAAAVALFGGLT